MKGLDFVSQCLGVIVESKTLWIVLDYKSNGCLLDYMNSQPRVIDQKVACSIITDVCIGIHTLHSKKFIHGDLKPENVLLDSNLRVQVADFGMALPLHRGQMYNGLWGTIDYQAPEQLLENGVWNEKVDYFVVGIIFYMIISGNHPFGKAESEIEENTKSISYKMPDTTKSAQLFIRGTLCTKEQRIGDGSILRHPYIERQVSLAKHNAFSDVVIASNPDVTPFHDEKYFFAEIPADLMVSSK